MNYFNRLDEQIRAVCPIDGLAVSAPGDSSSVRIHFNPSATSDQQTQAKAVVAAFDWSDNAQAQWEAQKQAVEVANHPITQFLLAQIQAATPSWAPPTIDEAVTKIIEVQTAKVQPVATPPIERVAN